MRGVRELFLLSLLYPLFSMAETHTLYSSRSNGSLLTAYYDAPPHATSFPIVIFILGSQCESVAEWHELLKPRAFSSNIGLISLEKYGVRSIHEINLEEYDQANSRDIRIQDHLHFIKQLREGMIPGWNGELVLVGGSEGGMIAAALATHCSETVATMMLACGGGMSAEEEVVLALRRHLKEQCETEAELNYYEQKLRVKMAEMIADPTPYKHFLGYTYKWWSCHLQYRTMDDMLQINSPLYYAHGTDDAVIPIESADLAVAILEAAGKTNVVYRRINDCNHQIHFTHMHVFDEAFDWLNQILSRTKQDGVSSRQ